MGTAHFYGHFTFCTSERERGKGRTPRFCEYATLVHEAPDLLWCVFACCLCVCSACLPRHVAIAIDLSDVAACAKECSSVGAQRQVTQKDRLVAGFIVEDMLPLSTIESPRFRKILDKIPMTRKSTSDR